jgi:hypothetical protein
MRHAHLIDHLRELLDGGEDPQPFAVLADEELAAMDNSDVSELTVQPWIDEQTGLDPALAARFGARSLFLRGLLVPDDEDGAETLTRSDELRLTLDARRLGTGFVRAISRHGGVHTARINVLQAELGGFEEEVTADGFHLFAGCSYRVAAERIAVWAVPITAAPVASGSSRIPVERWPTWALDELGLDHRQVEIDLFLPRPEGDLGEERWVVAHDDDLAVLAEPLGPQHTELQVSPVTPGSLTARLRERLQTALGHDPFMS